VQFFLRSGLPQNPTLFKVWQYVAGDRPALNKREFYTAMKLVSMAQRNNGIFDDQSALKVMNGLGGPIPPPILDGLPLPLALASSIPPPPLPPQQQQPPRVPPSRPAPPPSSSFTIPVPPTATASWPLLTPEQATAYQTAFSQLDTDRDGYVQGTDCFGAFMQSGLYKDALRHIWSVVAGDAGSLSGHQFIQATYLIDCAKKGIPLPSALPAGQFPPVSGTVNLAAAAAGQQGDIYSSASMQAPELVLKASYDATLTKQQHQQQVAAAAASVVPMFAPSAVSGLAAADAARLEAERQAAIKAEEEQKKLEEERLAAEAKRTFFTNALAELRVAESKVQRATVEIQQRLELEAAEANGIEADYDAAYAQYSVAHAECGPLLEQLKARQEERSALSTNLDNLKAAVAALEEADPEKEQKEAAEAELLRKQVSELTIKKETLMLRAAAVERRKEAIQASLSTLKEAVTAAETQLTTVETTAKTVDIKNDKAALTSILAKTAALYNKLYDAAKVAMVPLPAEAIATIKRQASPFKYDDLGIADAGDWADFKDDGFRIVSALPPDNRLTTYTSPSLAAAAAEDAAAAALEGEKEKEGEGVEENDSGDGEKEVFENPVYEKTGEDDAADGEEEEGEGGDGKEAAEDEVKEEVTEEEDVPTEEEAKEEEVLEEEKKAEKEEAIDIVVEESKEEESKAEEEDEGEGELPHKGGAFGSTQELSAAAAAEEEEVGKGEETKEQAAAGGSDWTAF